MIGRQTELGRIMINASYNLQARTNSSGILVIVPGHALVGHSMSSVLVGDEFECQLKCVHTQPCKSFNVHFSSSQANKWVCELNSQTREMKPSDFKARKGSNYYGPVQVSRELILVCYWFFFSLKLKLEGCPMLRHNKILPGCVDVTNCLCVERLS